MAEGDVLRLNMRDEYDTCKKCGKELKDDESKKRGYGPTCWESIETQDINLFWLKGEENKVGYIERTEKVLRTAIVEATKHGSGPFAIGLAVSDILRYHCDFQLVVMIRKDLVKGLPDMTYPVGVDPLKVVEHQYIPVLWYDNVHGDKAYVGDSFKTEINLLGGAQTFPTDWIELPHPMTSEEVEADFEHIFDGQDKLFDMKYPAQGLDRNDIAITEDAVMRYYSPRLDEMMYEEMYEMQEAMKGEDRWYEPPPSLEGYFGNDNDVYRKYEEMFRCVYHDQVLLYPLLNHPLSKTVAERWIDRSTEAYIEENTDAYAEDIVWDWFDDEIIGQHMHYGVMHFLDDFKEYFLEFFK